MPIEDVETDGTGSRPAPAAGLAPDLTVEVMADTDLAAILFTSGTTGRPKGVMHPEFGEGVVAVVTAARSDLDPAAIGEVARENLSASSRPRPSASCPSYPCNAVGKVLKAELRMEFAGIFRAQSEREPC